MRARTIVTALALLALGAAGVEAQSTLKVGYINSALILDQAPEAQAANQQFNQDIQGYEGQVKALNDELEQMVQQYQQQQLTLSADAKARREEEIRQKQAELQQLVQQLEQQATRRQQELVQPVMDRITRVIEDIRTEGNYSMIFDVAAGSIISADPSLDLTDEVIRRLQAQGETGDDGGS